MRPWRIRLALRRSRVQWAFLAVVLAVSVLAATLLGTLFLLSVATETFAARAALNDAAPADVALTMRVDPHGTVDEVVAGTDKAAQEVFGDVPYTRTVTTQGVLLSVPRGDRPIALAYLGSTDALDSRVSIRSGEAPKASNGGPVQVLVPPALLYDLDLHVGDTIALAPYSENTAPADFIIVGTYAATNPDDPAWLVDRFLGAGHNPTAVVPFTMGATTDGYGPLYTVQADVETMPVDLVVVTYVPDFTGTSLSEVSAVLDRTANLDHLATRQIGEAANSVAVASNLPTTLGRVVGSLAVTRSSVLVMGLLLLVLAVAALSQTARLMAERRYGEQHLMVARGGSGRQLFRLGLIEAVALGVLTAVIAAPLARLAYLALAQAPVMADGGMDVDPGIPPLTWAVTGLVGFILIVILVAPLMRRQTTFVDAEQARSRPGRRAAFQRSGLDVAVLVLAVLAYWQLKNYKSPVLASGGVASVDPLLAAGPALALLAGALVAVRLIPPASKLLEAVAARGRKAVLPLAAWEVGRRSARAVSAILLLTLAVSIGTFAVTFLSSWHQSQDDQALYKHPPDVIVSGLTQPVLSQRAIVDDGTFAQSASPVVSQSALIDAAPDPGDFRNEFAGTPVGLVATDDEGLKTYGVGRLNEVGGSRIPESLVGKAPEEVNPVEIPGKPQELSMAVTASASQQLGTIEVALRAVLRDASGLYHTVELGQLPLDGESHTVTAAIATTSDSQNLTAPLYFVGIQAQWISLDPSAVPDSIDQTQPLTFELSIDDIASVVPIETIPAKDVPSVVEATPLVIPTDLKWTATGNGVGVSSLEPDSDQIHARVITSPSSVLRKPVSLALTAAKAANPVPLVVTGSVLDALALGVGDAVLVEVQNTLVPAVIVQRVPTVTGDAIGQQTIVANIAGLEVAAIQQGGRSVSPSQWWTKVADEHVDAYKATLPPDATVTSRVGLAQDLKNDSLRVAIQAALWLVTGAAVVLAALGFAVHAIVTVRAREIELAQMRAIGVLRGQLLRIVSSENALLSILGLVFGLGLGIALSYLVAPLVSVGADGRPPLPPVIVHIPWDALGVLVIEVAVVLAVSIIIMSFMLRRIKPAQMLRMGDER